jgi:sugar transferase (PEP-CTERM/EpsH1 system associated)
MMTMSLARDRAWRRPQAGRQDVPLIAHVVYRFDVGGLENGVVNLLNALPRDRFRHAVVALTDVTSFRRRVLRDDIEFIALGKGPGHAFRLYPRLISLFRRLRPDVVHTRNLAALEASLPAWLAGVPVRIHGEHGRDVTDLDGSNRAYRLVRRAYRPCVTHYVALSNDLQRYLVDAVGVPPTRVTAIINGTDTKRYTPSIQRAWPDGFPFADPQLRVFGTVGRLEAVKNQAALARAFARALEAQPRLRARLRLVVVGDGRLRADVIDVLRRADALDLAWLPGSRDDIPQILRALDVFVLPSLAEGISNTILEAMASGLPVIATSVGGNVELVEHGSTGLLVPARDDEALSQALLTYANDPTVARAAGRAGRERAERLFSLEAMVDRYAALYDALIARSGVRVSSGRPATPITPEVH